MARAMGYYTYTGVKEVAAGGILPLENTIRQYGQCIRLKDNTIKLRSTATCNGVDRAAGYYTVHVNATLTASAEGQVTVSLYQDGNLVPGAVQTSSAAENDIVNFGFTAPVRIFCNQRESNLMLYVNSQQVNTMNVAVEVVKE